MTAELPLMPSGHDMTFYKESDYAYTLLEHIKKHFSDPVSADVIVKVVDLHTKKILDEFPLHRFILMQCDYFAAMLITRNFQESKSGVAELHLDSNDYNPKCTRLFFEMLYSENFDALSELGSLALNLYAMCRFFRFKRGEEYCERFLSDNMESNIVNLCEFAVFHQATRLQTSCFNWIRTFVPISSQYQQCVKGIPKDILKQIFLDGPCNANRDEVTQIGEYLSEQPAMALGNSTLARVSFEAQQMERTGNIYKLKEGVFWEGLFWNFLLVRIDNTNFRLSVIIDHQTAHQNHQVDSILARSCSKRSFDFRSVRLRLCIFLRGETLTREIDLSLSQGLYYRHDTDICVNMDWCDRAYRSGVDFDPDNLRERVDPRSLACAHNSKVVFGVITLSR